MMEKRRFSMKKLILSFLAALMISFTSAVFADFGDILGPTITGAAIGGIAGGSRGAGIGAGVGFGLGLINSAEQDRRRAYYYDDYGYSRPVRYRRTYYRQPVYRPPRYQYLDEAD
jgi:hypothetical protein